MGWRWRLLQRLGSRLDQDGDRDLLLPVRPAGRAVQGRASGPVVGTDRRDENDKTAGQRLSDLRFCSGGQGRGRTADLPIFSRTLVPTELPGRTEAERYRTPSVRTESRPIGYAVARGPILIQP